MVSLPIGFDLSKAEESRNILYMLLSIGILLCKQYLVLLYCTGAGDSYKSRQRNGILKMKELRGEREHNIRIRL